MSRDFATVRGKFSQEYGRISRKFNKEQRQKTRQGAAQRLSVQVLMHMKEDHMRNAQLKPGYNVQFGVEGEYITGVFVSSERSDQMTLIPLLEGMKEHGIEYRDVTADAGYEGEENYSYFEEHETECYIKPQNYERSKTRKYKSNMALRENMAYNEVKDEYTCQAGQKLRAKYVGKRKNKNGFESEIAYYECDDCSGCPYKKSCTRAKGNRQLHVSKRFIQQRAASLKRITGEHGILLRMNRSIQSEGAFGAVKQNYGFRQFLLRGHKKGNNRDSDAGYGLQYEQAAL